MPAKGKHQALATTPHYVACTLGVIRWAQKTQPTTSMSSILTLPKLHLSTFVLLYYNTIILFQVQTEINQLSLEVSLNLSMSGKKTFKKVNYYSFPWLSSYICYYAVKLIIIKLIIIIICVEWTYSFLIHFCGRLKYYSRLPVFSSLYNSLIVLFAYILIGNVPAMGVGNI